MGGGFGCWYPLIYLRLPAAFFTCAQTVKRLPLQTHCHGTDWDVVSHLAAKVLQHEELRLSAARVTVLIVTAVAR